MKELIILENFKGKMEPDLQLFLADKKVKTAYEAAVYADNYYLVRKHVKPKGKDTTGTNQSDINVDTSQETKVSSPSNSASASQNTHTHNPP